MIRQSARRPAVIYSRSIIVERKHRANKKMQIFVAEMGNGKLNLSLPATQRKVEETRELISHQYRVKPLQVWLQLEERKFWKMSYASSPRSAWMVGRQRFWLADPTRPWGVGVHHKRLPTFSWSLHFAADTVVLTSAAIHCAVAGLSFHTVDTHFFLVIHYKKRRIIPYS
jgi:hypothetical protein